MEKNIINAIEAEKEYIYNKIHHIYPVKSIYDYIGEYGYDNLQDFRYDKMMFELKNIGIEIIEIPAVSIEHNPSLVIQYARIHRPVLLYSMHMNNDTLFLPISSNAKYENCQVIYPGYDCDPEKGHMFSFDGDLNIVIFLPKKYDKISKYLLDVISEYLSSKTDKNITIDHNDILADGFKVAGIACMNDDTYYGLLCHISFSDKTNSLKNLFPYNEKTPANIDFAEPEKLLNHITSWLQ